MYVELAFGQQEARWAPPDSCSKMCVNSAKKQGKREHSRQERIPKKPDQISLPYTSRHSATPAYNPLKIMVKKRFNFEVRLVLGG